MGLTHCPIAAIQYVTAFFRVSLSTFLRIQLTCPPSFVSDQPVISPSVSIDFFLFILWQISLILLVEQCQWCVQDFVFCPNYPVSVWLFAVAICIQWSWSNKQLRWIIYNWTQWSPAIMVTYHSKQSVGSVHNTLVIRWMENKYQLIFFNFIFFF